MALTITPTSQTRSRPVVRPYEAVVRGLITTARPYQWAKNVAVLIVPGLALLTLGFGQIASSAVAVLAFCLAASSVYFLNDTLDRPSDRHHPDKRLRPIASGVISPTMAIAATAVLASAGLAMAFAVSIGLGLIVASYLLITTGYSLALKHIPIVDIATLAVGFVLRVLAGGIAIGTVAPPLLLVAVFAAASMIALGKRHAEVVLLGDDAAAHRRTLGTYTRPWLRRSLIDMQAVSVIAFAAWVFTAVASPYSLALSVTAGVSLHLALGAYRKSLVHTGSGGDPTRDLASNPLVLSSLSIAGLAALSTGIF